MFRHFAPGMVRVIHSTKQGQISKKYSKGIKKEIRGVLFSTQGLKAETQDWELKSFSNSIALLF